MKSKVIPLSDVPNYFRDGMTIMFGGFLSVGTPHALINALLESGAKDLTLIGNDTAMPGKGVAPLIENKRVRKIIVSHIGTNPETGRQMLAGELEVELSPQGTLAERIRAGGAGLGVVLTRTGLGTLVEEGKQRLTANGRDYLLELPLRADIALVHAARGDKAGNLQYQLTARNFNPLVALAGDIVLAQVDDVVETGMLDPDHVMTPAAVIDGVVKS